jgi:hypothetical protein
MTSFPKSLFDQADDFIMPQTQMYDFFDYLAGEKIVLPENKDFCDVATVTFKYNPPQPKPVIHKYQKKSRKENFKTIELRAEGKAEAVRIEE